MCSWQTFILLSFTIFIFCLWPASQPAWKTFITLHLFLDLSAREKMFSRSPPRLLHRIAVLVVLSLLGKWPRVRGKQLTLEAKRKQTSHFSQDTVRELRKNNNNTSCGAKVGKLFHFRKLQTL